MVKKCQNYPSNFETVLVMKVRREKNGLDTSTGDSPEVINIYQGNLIFICRRNPALKSPYSSQNKQGSRTITNIESALCFKGVMSSTYLQVLK